GPVEIRLLSGIPVGIWLPPGVPVDEDGQRGRGSAQPDRTDAACSTWLLHVAPGWGDVHRALALDLHHPGDALQRADDVLVRLAGDDGDCVVNRGYVEPCRRQPGGDVTDLVGFVGVDRNQHFQLRGHHTS